MRTETGTSFLYAVGEEVVVRLDAVAIYHLERGGPLPEVFRPPWAIAAVAGRVARHGSARYLLRFVYGDATCICQAGEGAIEGTA